MSSSLSYSRKFIILKREYGTISRGNVKGHCKIERKGSKATVTVNVENGDIESIYNVALISNEKQSPILTLGKLFTDETGRGKGEYTLTERELIENKYKITGVLVMVGRDILLGGYIDKDDGSIERYINNLSLVSQVEKIEEITEEITEEVEEKVNEEVATILEEKTPVEEFIPPKETIPLEEVSYMEGITSEEEVFLQEHYKTEEIPQEKENEIIETVEGNYPQDFILEELNNDVIINEIYQEFPQEVETPIIHELINEFDEESMEPDYKTLEYIKKLNHKNQTINYVLSILRFFPYAEPFKYSLKGYNWWLIDLDTENEYKAFLPYFAHIVGGNNREYYDNSITTCTQLMNKYQHYLFGLYNEGEQVKYFLYGIPGTFTLDEHPYRGANGFNTWYEGQYVPGYWIIYIDPMTGKAMDLPNPMIPIN